MLKIQEASMPLVGQHSTVETIVIDRLEGGPAYMTGKVSDKHKLLVWESMTSADFERAGVSPHHYIRTGAIGNGAVDQRNRGRKGTHQLGKVGDAALFSRHVDLKPSNFGSAKAAYFKDASVSKARAPLWSAVRAIVRAWSSLEEDWDGDDAAPLEKRVLSSVADFVRKAEVRNVAEPRPYISSDGEVGFHWDTRLRASISFLAEGRFLAYIERSELDPFRLAGPLDIATASDEMFDALSALR